MVVVRSSTPPLWGMWCQFCTSARTPTPAPPRTFSKSRNRWSRSAVHFDAVESAPSNGLVPVTVCTKAVTFLTSFEGVGGQHGKQTQEELKAAQANALESKYPHEQTQSFKAQHTGQCKRLAGKQKDAQWYIEKIEELSESTRRWPRSATRSRTKSQQQRQQQHSSTPSLRLPPRSHTSPTLTSHMWRSLVESRCSWTRWRQS
ncbi:unnamed protein product [Prorocentrum cordatum]|uniref:Uncharacterized protein n=1 Tax=Prorocentrum cordatum TaxID=2364126 RepID=A0ABN9RZ60_9DINO|nr:unnamed protein product [Polarella glacialis]